MIVRKFNYNQASRHLFLVIPRKVQLALGLQGGELAVWSVQGDKIIIRFVREQQNNGERP